MHSKWAFLSLPLALAALLSGCGNEKRDFRLHTLGPLVKRLTDQRTEVAEVLRLAKPGRKRDVAQLRAEVAGLRVTTGRITALKPPDDVGAPFVRYTDANRRLVQALARFVDVFARGTAGLPAAGHAVTAAASTADRAQTTLFHALR